MDELLSEANANGDPVRDHLLFGEAVALKSSRVLNRRGRSLVRVRIVGRSSLGWVEAAEAWGCNVEAVVVKPLREMSKIIHLVSRFTITSVATALTMPPMGDWNGLMLATVCSEEESSLANRMLHAWQPWIVIFAYPPHLSRSRVLRLGPHPRSSYEKKTIKCRHTDVGGVTNSSWTLLHFSRLHTQPSRPSLMTMNVYPRPLQTALDDTVGGRWCDHQDSFELRDDLGDNVLGTVVDRKDGRTRSLYSADRVGPDISTMAEEDRFFWVSAASVRSKDHVFRRVKTYELFSIWDYEGKLESVEWSRAEAVQVLRYRTLSPPAKMIRLFLSKAADAIVQEVMGAGAQQVIGPTLRCLKAGLTRDVPFTPMEAKVDTRVEAKLADDAEVNLSTWAVPGETKRESEARVVLRRFAARWWAYNLERNAWNWWRLHGKDPADADAIVDCVRRAKACTYWHWTRGSRIMPWRCSAEFHDDFRDGIEFWHLGPAPRGMVHNLPAPSREAEIESRKKVFKLKFQGNLDAKRFVNLCVPRFAITKVMLDSVVVDIRVVWDSKSNGHNATLWAPGFMLDDAGDLVELVVKWLAVPMSQYIGEGSPPQDYTQPESKFTKSKQGDVDVGGMFHNFRAHAKEQANLGVRWMETRNDGAPERHEFLRFNVLHFGGKCSPYLASQAQGRILEGCMGNRHDLANRWQWDRVHLNLPCSHAYDPSLPRVLLLRKDGELATRLTRYVDDIHPVGRDAPDPHGVGDGRDEQTKLACKQLKSRMNSRGNQADDRKYRPPSLTPGAWNGIIMQTDTPFPHMTTTQRKWTRLKSGLDWIWETARDSDVIDTAELRRIAGLAVNVTEVYSDCRSYLKGMFNALESWRWDRDLDGWRLQQLMEDAADLEVNHAARARAGAGYPLETKITGEMLMHVEALRVLFEGPVPLAVPIRPTDINKLRYVIGDASAEGFGAGTQYPDLVFEGRDGLWLTDFAEGGSNLREAQNLANHLLADIRAGKYDGCEVWTATDNAVWSYVWTKGLSTAKHLFGLVLELRIAARDHEVYLKTCHISGKRMIAAGMDGWSRGNHDAGLSLGYDIRNYLPLNLSAWEVAGQSLEPWFKNWMGEDYSPPLEPVDWFEKGHQPGIHIWSPPPAAALIALRSLARSRLKRPYTTSHIVIIPRLLYQEEWRGRFEKEVDLWFVFHHGTCWPHLTLEPLMFGIRFPLYRSYPWELKQDRDRMVELGRTLSQVSQTCHVQLGDYLRKLWRNPRTFSTM